MFRSLRCLSSVLLASAATVSCSSDHNPYDALSEEAAAFVIPNSEDWGSGEMCSSGGDCGGPITIEVIEGYDWVRVAGLSIDDVESRDGTVEAVLVVADAPSEDASTNHDALVRMWGPDVEKVERTLNDGFDVWAGVSPESRYAVVFFAFDSAGRFAGVGHVAGDFFTVPVARLAANANATSGFEFLSPLMER